MLKSVLYSDISLPLQLPVFLRLPSVAVCLRYAIAVASYVIIILVMIPAGMRLYKAKATYADNLVLTLTLVLCALQHPATIFVTV